MLVLMLSQAWEQDYGPKPEVAATETINSVPVKQDLPSTSTDSQVAESHTETAAPVLNAANSKAISVKTDVIELEIDLQGGTIRRLDLLDYPVERDNSVVNQLRSLVGLPTAEKITRPSDCLTIHLKSYLLPKVDLLPVMGKLHPIITVSFTVAKIITT